MVNNDYKTWRKMVSQRVPALAPILYAMSYHEDDKAGDPTAPNGTFQVNPWSLEMTYSPKFAEKNTVEQNSFVLAHEAGHVLCEHGKRRMAVRDREGTSFLFPLWQMAEEMAVNELIKTLSGWEQPKDSVYCHKDCTQMSTEEIYDYLRKNTKITHIKCGQCIKGNGKDEKGNPLPVDAATEMLREAAVESGQKTAVQGREAGNESGELKRIQIALKGFAKPPDMRQLLRKYLIAMDNNCKHFDPATIYKRRLDMDGLVMPNLSSSPIARKFVVSIDNSGSIGDEEFSEFKSILNDTAKQLGFQEIVVQHFTTQVMKTERYFDLSQLKKMNREANGGTAIDDCDEKAAQHRGQFHLILTDGYVGWLEQYHIPTLVILTQPTEHPPVVPGLVATLDMSKGKK